MMDGRSLRGIASTEITGGTTLSERLDRLDARLSLRVMLLGFWCAFWLLNGLDKFFNQPHFFGVTRDEKFVEYFARLQLPPSLALGSLYTCGVAEALLGVGFAAALATGLRALERLALKASLLIFFTFSVGDVLFGDRMELWEHVTFLVLVLASMGLLKAEGEQW